MTIKSAARVTVALAATFGMFSVAAAETLYITADRMIDVLAGKTIEQPAVIVEGDRIANVGSRSQLPAPAGARQLSLNGMTLLPGLIDMHVHLTFRHDMHGYRRLGISIPKLAIDSVAHAEATLLAGFTAARDVHAVGYTDVALRDAINEGRVKGPRLWVSGPSLGATGGHSDSNLLAPQFAYHEDGAVDGPWALVQKVREVHKYGADLIKISATGGVITKNTHFDSQELAPEEISAIVGEAHRLGMKVAAHAHGASGIKNAILAGVDTIEHASFIDEEGIKLAKQRGTYLTMDIYNTEYTLAVGEAAGYLPESLEKERIVGRMQRESFTRAVKGGARMLFGTDAALFPHGQNALQFSRMVQFGMTPMQAIQSATADAGRALGAEHDVGAIAIGRFADLIAVPGDPLAEISILEKVPVVIKGGVVVKDAR
ncbi:metal-dependent hydrolase family protein [Steroidobacter sp.]|uniref:Xaa-Pro dipeptidase n=1 Tax=Steroidobacter sp. TaxID=1978227 RepID=UPI001A611BF1|nr:amidohydrolase family protein [Steroidobacter sp.]MBL8268489.1 amidohydrolase family protein [Steroidobacter sp.]